MEELGYESKLETEFTARAMKSKNNLAMKRDPEDYLEIWVAAWEIADHGKITSKHVELAQDALNNELTLEYIKENYKKRNEANRVNNTVAQKDNTNGTNDKEMETIMEKKTTNGANDMASIS